MTGIKPNLRKPRQIARCESDKEAQRRLRSAKSQRAAYEPEQHALHEQLAGNALSIRTKCRANRELMSATRGFDEQQVGDVRARDQQDDTHTAHQHPERVGHVTHHVEF